MMKIRMTLLLTALVLFGLFFPGKAYAAQTKICEPADETVCQAGESVMIKASAGYVVPEGTDLFSRRPNYLYFRVSKDGQTVLYDSRSYKTDLGVFSYARKAFTPAEEGEYLIEICRDSTYVNGRHVELSEEDFQADASVRIFVGEKPAAASTDCRPARQRSAAASARRQIQKITGTGAFEGFLSGLFMK